VPSKRFTYFFEVAVFPPVGCSTWWWDAPSVRTRKVRWTFFVRPRPSLARSYRRGRGPRYYWWGRALGMDVARGATVFLRGTNPMDADLTKVRRSYWTVGPAVDCSLAVGAETVFVRPPFVYFPPASSARRRPLGLCSPSRQTRPETQEQLRRCTSFISRTRFSSIDREVEVLEDSTMATKRTRKPLIRFCSSIVGASALLRYCPVLFGRPPAAAHFFLPDRIWGPRCFPDLFHRPSRRLQRRRRRRRSREKNYLDRIQFVGRIWVSPRRLRRRRLEGKSRAVASSSPLFSRFPAACRAFCRSRAPSEGQSTVNFVGDRGPLHDVDLPCLFGPEAFSYPLDPRKWDARLKESARRERGGGLVRCTR